MWSKKAPCKMVTRMNEKARWRGKERERCWQSREQGEGGGGGLWGGVTGWGAPDPPAIPSPPLHPLLCFPGSIPPHLLPRFLLPLVPTSPKRSWPPPQCRACISLIHSFCRCRPDTYHVPGDVTDSKRKSSACPPPAQRHMGGRATRHNEQSPRYIRPPTQPQPPGLSGPSGQVPPAAL